MCPLSHALSLSLRLLRCLSLSLWFCRFYSLSLVFIKEGEREERQQQSSQMPFPFWAKSHHILPPHTFFLFFAQLFIKATLHPSLLHQRPSRLPPLTYHSFRFSLSISLKSHLPAVRPSLPTCLSGSVSQKEEEMHHLKNSSNANLIRDP